VVTRSRFTRTLAAPKAKRIVLDTSRYPLCPDAEAFLVWCQASYPDVHKSSSYRELDKILAAMTREYVLRQQHVSVHQNATCLGDIFLEQAGAIVTRQLVLTQEHLANPPPPPPVREVERKPALYIGELVEEK
jgi:hypothetical protein